MKQKCQLFVYNNWLKTEKQNNWNWIGTREKARFRHTDDMADVE